MFARLATVVLFILPAIIAVPTYGPSESGSCNTGEVMCCNDATNVDPSSTQGIAGTLLGGTLGGLDVPINVLCNPITSIGADGQSCSGQSACCTQNDIHALVSLACDPINVNA